MKKIKILAGVIALCLVGCSTEKPSNSNTSFEWPRIVTPVENCLNIPQAGCTNLDSGIVITYPINQGYLLEILCDDMFADFDVSEDGKLYISVVENVTKSILTGELSIKISSENEDIVVTNSIRLMQPGLEYMVKKECLYTPDDKMFYIEENGYDEFNSKISTTYSEIPETGGNIQELRRKRWVNEDGKDILYIDKKVNNEWAFDTKEVETYDSATSTGEFSTYLYSVEKNDWVLNKKVVTTRNETYDQIDETTYDYSTGSEVVLERKHTNIGENTIETIYYSGNNIFPLSKTIETDTLGTYVIDYYACSITGDFYFTKSEMTTYDVSFDELFIKQVISYFEKTSEDGEYVLTCEETNSSNEEGDTYKLETDYYVDGKYSRGEREIYQYDVRQLVYRIDYYDLTSNEDEGTLNSYRTFEYIATDMSL